MRKIIKKRNKNYALADVLREYDCGMLAHSLEDVLVHSLHAEIMEGEEDEKEYGSVRMVLQGGGFTDSTSISLNEKYGDLEYTDCTCMQYRGDYFSCRHITNLLMAYFLETYGEEIFEDTEIKRQLIRNTGVENPFLPGILRKTSPELASFLKIQNKNKKNLDPLWMRNPKNPVSRKNSESGKDAESLENGTAAKTKKLTKNAKTARKVSSSGPLYVDCILCLGDQEGSIELKIGPKHRYVIGYEHEFLQAYLDQGFYTFGKNQYSLDRSSFTEEGASIVDFFANLYDSYQKMGRSHHVLPMSGNNQRRYFTLMGRDYDAFMNMLDGKAILVDDRGEQERCIIDLKKSVEPYHLKKETYGATLSNCDEKLLGCGMDCVYIKQKNYILALPKKQYDLRKSLTGGLFSEADMYIQDKDIPVLLDTFSQIDPEMSLAVFEGFNLDQYGKEQPEIQIYLDYPQEGLFSCTLKAHYPKAHKTFSIFDMKKGKKIRDFQAERPVGEKMWQFFNAYDETEQTMYHECQEDGLYHFLVDTIPQISKLGQVFISDAVKRLKVRPVSLVDVGLKVDEGSLLMNLHSDSITRQEMVEMLSSYRRKKNYTRLKNGEFLVFDHKNDEMWETLADTFRNYGKKNPEAMKIPLYRAFYLDEMLNNQECIQLSTDERYLTLLENIKEDEYKKAVPPKSLEKILRPYQQDGFAWIKMLKTNGFGGILADDMGLGKTLQVLAFLQSEKEEKKAGNALRTLVVTPASLVYNWQREIETFTPELKCTVIAGTASERQNILRILQEVSKDSDISKGDNSNKLDEPGDIYITSYDLLKRDIEKYEDIIFANEIIDEAQFIKNQNTLAAKSVRLVQGAFRLALTGTPIENRLSEMWSIFEYLMPGFLYSYSRFRTEFEAPVIQNHDEEVLNRLRNMIHPFILRRLKQDVLKDLPEKLEETVVVALHGQQRKLYDAYAERLRLFLEKQNEEEFQHGKLEILAELTKLRQLCCGPGLFLEEYYGENAKQDACLELIRQAIDGGHKVLVFSQFTKVLDALGQGLQKEKIAYHRIDGSTSKKDRMKQVNSFAKDDISVFCISLKAGGTGLNLTAADIVIHYDPWWNVAAQNQATDRTHRIGQENHVVVYQLIADRTIEQQIVKLQQTKSQLAEDVLSGEGIASILIDKKALLELL